MNTVRGQMDRGIPEEIESLLAVGHELPNLEVKWPGPRDHDLLRGKVLRAMMAMANRRDGGFVVVGITETDALEARFKVEGVSSADALTWDHDRLSDVVRAHVSGDLAFHVATVSVDAATLVVIRVDEFARRPVICIKPIVAGTTTIVRAGGLPVRGHVKVESLKFPGPEEMEALVRLAAQKRAAEIIAEGRAAGLVMPQVEDAFSRQLGDGL
jgi:hypothetical protein